MRIFKKLDISLNCGYIEGGSSNKRGNNMADKKDRPANRVGKPENLKPFKKGDDRASKAGKKGGKQSAIVQREKRSLQESLQRLLYTELTPGQKKAFSKMGYDIDENKSITHMDLAGARCLAKVIATGDLKALSELAKLAGIHTEESKLIIDDQSAPQRTIIELSLGQRPENIPGEETECESE